MSLSHFQLRRCSLPSCDKSEDKLPRDAKLLKCGGCVKQGNPDPAVYCSKDCQMAHWKLEGGHRGRCKDLPPEVQGKNDFAAKWRKCHDGSYHHGDFELITWNTVEVDADGDVTEKGWGGCYRYESADLKAKFKGEFGGDKKQLLKHRPQAFRWTCCGMSGDSIWGCDHHGDPAARMPCKCDFCRGGKQLPQGIWERKLHSQAAQGLKDLRRGPDPRSVNMAGMFNFQMRELMGGMMGLEC